MSDQPLDLLAVQLATRFTTVLSALQRQVNAAVANGAMEIETGQELTRIIEEASVLPAAIATSADAHHATTKRSTEARRAGGRMRGAGAKRRVQKRDLELLAAAVELRKANPDRSINSLAKRLAPRFSCSESTLKKRLIALNFASLRKTGPRA